MRGHFHIDFMNSFGLSEDDIIMMLALRNGGVLSEIISNKTQIELPSRFFKEDN